MRSQLRSSAMALVVVASLFPSVASAACPTAPEDIPINLFVWKTQRDLQGFVWSSDGSQILGIEHVYEIKQYWDFLFGLKTETRKDCQQLYWTTLESASRVNLGGPSELEVVSAYAFPKAGYVVVEKHSGSSPWQSERVALDGTRRPLASISGACDWARVVPSPDGSLIAYAHSVQTSCSSTSLDGSTTTVSFFDVGGAPVGKSGSVTLAGYAQATWTPAGQLVVSDGTSASAVAPDGSATPVAPPRCTDPPTTSSDVDANGRFLAIDNGKAGVAGVDLSRAFGCQ